MRWTRPWRTSGLAGLMSRWAGDVPQAADDPQAVVDHVIVHLLDVADLGGAVEELGHHHARARG